MKAVPEITPTEKLERRVRSGETALMDICRGDTVLRIVREHATDPHLKRIIEGMQASLTPEILEKLDDYVDLDDLLDEPPSPQRTISIVQRMILEHAAIEMAAKIDKNNPVAELLSSMSGQFRTLAHKAALLGTDKDRDDVLPKLTLIERGHGAAQELARGQKPGAALPEDANGRLTMSDAAVSSRAMAFRQLFSWNDATAASQSSAPAKPGEPPVATGSKPMLLRPEYLRRDSRPAMPPPRLGWVTDHPANRVVPEKEIREAVQIRAYRQAFREWQWKMALIPGAVSGQEWMQAGAPTMETFIGKKAAKKMNKENMVTLPKIEYPEWMKIFNVAAAAALRSHLERGRRNFGPVSALLIDLGHESARNPNKLGDFVESLFKDRGEMTFMLDQWIQEREGKVRISEPLDRGNDEEVV